MSSKAMKFIFILLSVFLTSVDIFGQTPNEHIYSLDSLFSQAMNNNQALKLSEAQVNVTQQRVSVVEAQRLPNISLSTSAYYLGDATVYDKDLSNKTSVSMPHNGRSFTIQASEVVFRGFAIKNNIEASTLQHQIASLSFEKNKQDIKLLIAGYYLDIFRLRNQRLIYLKNIELSAIRLRNIEKMREQGLVLNNDIIRTKLMISNLNLALTQIEDNLAILNHQLTIAVGLPTDITIVPDTNIILKKPIVQNLENYQKEAASGYVDILTAGKNVQLAEKNIAIAQADRLPVVSLFAANSLQRPITSRSPAVDMYSNGWQSGITLSYPISALYSAPRNIKLARLQLRQSEQALALQQQNTDIAVNSTYLKHVEAFQQWETAKVNMQLANENYGTTEKKYLNQLVLLIDMLDAENIKLESEIQNTNAEINIIFTYYKLLNITGKL